MASATFAGRWDRWHRNARRTSGWGGLLYVVPALVILLIFEIWPLVSSWMFNYQVGVVNAVLERLGLPTSTWLRDPAPALERLLVGLGVSEAALKAWPDLAAGPSVALVVVILFSIWTNLGYSVVVYLAGMTAIPRDLRDAARVDGAGPWQTVRSVVWPLLAPTTVFLVIFNTITAFQAFTPIYTLTRNVGMGRAEAGGPLDTTLTITVAIFRNFYERANSVGFAAALSIFLFVLMLGLTMAQFRLLGRSTDEP